MSSSEMERLASDYVANPSLQSMFGSAESLDQAVKVANGAGYEVEEGEVKEYLGKLQSDSQAELSDTQLDAVSGGKHHGPNFTALLDVQDNGGSLFGTPGH